MVVERRVCRTVATLVGLVVASLLLAGLPPSTAEAVTPCSRGTIALTFDDGPHPTHTPRVLDKLQRRRVRATFFQVGARIHAYPALTRRAHREGHRIANHTWGHDRLTSLSNDGVRSTLRRTNRRVTDLGVPTPTVVRPPYGAINARVRSVIESLGMQPRLWTVDSNDWRTGRSASAITRTVLGGLHDRANVLMHDGVANSPATIAALPGIIDGARIRGYCIGTLDAAGRVRPPVPTAGLQGVDTVEGAKGTSTDAFVTVRLSEPTSREVSVAFRTVDETATADEDYRPTSGRLRFGVGQTAGRVKVRVRGDDVDEPDERIRVVLSDPAGMRLPAKPHARIRILDDDPPPSDPQAVVTILDDDVVTAAASDADAPPTARPMRLSADRPGRRTGT